MEKQFVDFGEARRATEFGLRACRDGWNGKGMFIFERPSDELEFRFVTDIVRSIPQTVKDFLIDNNRENYENGDTLPTLKFSSYLCLYSANGDIVNGWLPSQSDLKAKDWIILD